jgi:hypothetical protein
VKHFRPRFGFESGAVGVGIFLAIASRRVLFDDAGLAADTDGGARNSGAVRCSRPRSWLI